MSLKAQVHTGIFCGFSFHFDGATTERKRSPDEALHCEGHSHSAHKSWNSLYKLIHLTKLNAKLTHFKIYIFISCINNLSTEFSTLIPINHMGGKSIIKQQSKSRLFTIRPSYSQRGPQTNHINFTQELLPFKTKSKSTFSQDLQRIRLHY